MATLQAPFPTDGKLQRNTQGGWLRDLLASGSFDNDEFVDNFVGDQLLAIYPSAKVSNGTVVFTEHNVNGYLEIKSGGSTGDYAGQGIGMQWTGDREVLAQFIIRTPATITNWKFEVGLSDNDQDAGAVNQKATTTTSNAEDYAVFIYDTTDDSNIAFHSAKANAEIVTADIEALRASTTYRFAIRVVGDNIEAYINGTKVAGHGESTGIEGGNGLTPWVFSQARSGSERILRLYKWGAIQPAY